MPIPRFSDWNLDERAMECAKCGLRYGVLCSLEYGAWHPVDGGDFTCPDPECDGHDTKCDCGDCEAEQAALVGWAIRDRVRDIETTI